MAIKKSTAIYQKSSELKGGVSEQFSPLETILSSNYDHTKVMESYTRPAYKCPLFLPEGQVRLLKI
jgi:hypothetical protein